MSKLSIKRATVNSSKQVGFRSKVTSTSVQHNEYSIPIQSYRLVNVLFNSTIAILDPSCWSHFKAVFEHASSVRLDQILTILLAVLYDTLVTRYPRLWARATWLALRFSGLLWFSHTVQSTGNDETLDTDITNSFNITSWMIIQGQQLIQLIFHHCAVSRMWLVWRLILREILIHFRFKSHR